jgi:branched-chain amino acid transport system ATP-binding protein
LSQVGQADGALLEVSNLCAGYGKRQVLIDVSLSVRASEILAVVGSNGAGKSTFLKAIFGLNRIFSGEVQFRGRKITGRTPHKNVSEGMIYLPQGNRAFDDLTVRENLLMGGYSLRKAEATRRMETTFAIFPELEKLLSRHAVSLSGGEKQMLAFARALMLRPVLLLLDEPSVGLSPKLVSEVMQKISSIRDELRPAIVVVEQKIKQVLTICDRVAAMKLGSVVFQGSPAEFSAQARSILLG